MDPAAPPSLLGRRPVRFGRPETERLTMARSRKQTTTGPDAGRGRRGVGRGTGPHGCSRASPGLPRVGRRPGRAPAPPPARTNLPRRRPCAESATSSRTAGCGPWPRWTTCASAPAARWRTRVACAGRLLRGFLEVHDNFSGPCTPRDSRDQGGAEAIRQGVEMMAQKLQAVRQGVPIEAVGREFDPALHEAVAQIPREGGLPAWSSKWCSGDTCSGDGPAACPGHRCQ